MATSFDVCNGLTFDTDITTFDCSSVGDNTVELTVTDANGNYAAQLTSPNVTGAFTVNITADCPTYGIK